MMKRLAILRIAAIMIGAGLLIANPAIADVALSRSPLEASAAQVDFDISAQFAQFTDGAADTTFGDFMDDESKLPGRRSPLKAFLFSAAVPGLGQWYNGSKLKALGFFGVDVAAWLVHFSWHSTAGDMEAEFEAFNRAHWHESDYEDYLRWVYPEDTSATGEIDDEWVDATEISHNLPDTRTQQYYEMTGKYDQFAWGWDDALYNDSTLSDMISSNRPAIPIMSSQSAPRSANRDIYEEMRNDANNKFDDANRMIIVSIVNRLVSGIEAYLEARRHNDNLARASLEPRLKVRAQLKSVYTSNDTPFLNVAYRF